MSDNRMREIHRKACDVLSKARKVEWFFASTYYGLDVDKQVRVKNDAGAIEKELEEIDARLAALVKKTSLE